MCRQKNAFSIQNILNKARINYIKKQLMNINNIELSPEEIQKEYVYLKNILKGRNITNNMIIRSILGL